jgi:hypothetical protein
VTAFIRSLPSVHQLAPGYESVGVDRALQNHRGVNLPGVDPYLMRAADEVHGQIRAAVDKRACVTRYRPVAGHLQPTATTAVFDGERLIFVNTIHDVDNGGDGTVPLFSAHPAEWDGDDDMQDLIRRDSGQHGGLQDLKGVRDQISGWLGRRVSYRGPEGEYGIGVEAPDFVLAGEPLAVAATVPEEVGRPRLIARVRNVDGRRAVEKQLVYGGEPRCRAEFPGLAAGVYEVRVGPLELPSGLAATPGRPVVKHLVVWAEGDEA